MAHYSKESPKMTIWISVLIFVVTMVILSESAATKRSYTAAAFEHARFGQRSDPPSLIIEKNLELYKKAAEVASSRGADIIVYPEYGVFPPGNRMKMKYFLEDIPDPKKGRINPCEEQEHYLQMPILYTLSCIAKNKSIVVVANTGDIKQCCGQPDCPKDGVFHFNTNVVFDKNGTMLVKYHKEHLYFESGMDLAREKQDPIFTTDFGTFATYVCFDIIFGRMKEVANRPDIDGVMFTTMWMDATPQFVSVSHFQGWAIGNNVTLVVANINIPGSSAVGSGIFHKVEGSLGYTYDTDGVSKLVIAKVPAPGQCATPLQGKVTVITTTKSWEKDNCGEDVPNICSGTHFNVTGDITRTYRCLQESMLNYTFVKLTQPNGFAEACNNGMCCSVSYSADMMNENFYLGVFNGTYSAYNRYQWCEENCFIARCDVIKGKICSNFPRITNTLFHHVELRANFSTQFIYPSIVSSRVRLVPRDEFQFDIIKKPTSYKSSIHFYRDMGRRLVTVGFKARCYDRDPRYV